MKKITLEYLISLASDRGCVFLSDEYVGIKHKYKIKCSCGNIYEPRLDRFLEGRRCAKCSNKENAKNRKLKLEDVKNVFESIGFELMEEKYENAVTKMKYKCKCGEIAEVTYNQLTRRIKRNVSVGCSKCRNDNISKANKGREGLKGCNNPSWNPNRTNEQRKEERKTAKDYNWKKNVREMYDFTCLKCNYRGGHNVVHHINSYDIHESQRYDIKNGAVLCEKCHKDFHVKYGYGKNTREQFEEWIKAD